MQQIAQLETQVGGGASHQGPYLWASIQMASAEKRLEKQGGAKTGMASGKPWASRAGSRLEEVEMGAQEKALMKESQPWDRPCKQ